MTDQTFSVLLCNKTGNYGILPVFSKASWDRFTYPETKNGKKNRIEKASGGGQMSRMIPFWETGTINILFGLFFF